MQIIPPTVQAPQATPALVCAIEVRSVYGNMVAYPTNASARIFAAMLGTKTLTRAALQSIVALGFDIVSSANADWSDVR